MENSYENDIYRSPISLSYIVVGLFGGLILCSIAHVILGFVMIISPDALISLDNHQTMNLGFVLIGLVSLLETPLRVGTIVLFLVWLYRAFNNLSALKARNLEFSPGWAVGWWFIPFANLVKPFQVVRELYNESDPDFDEETGFLHVSGGTPALIGFWWGLYLAANFVSWVAKMLVNNNGIASPDFPMVLVVAGLLTILAASLVIIIVRKITQRQERRFAKIATQQNFQPPSPAMYFNPNA